MPSSERKPATRPAKPTVRGILPGLVVFAIVAILGVVAWSWTRITDQSANDNQNATSDVPPLELGNRDTAVRYERRAFGYAVTLPDGATAAVGQPAPEEGILDRLTINTGDASTTVEVQLVDAAAEPGVRASVADATERTIEDEGGRASILEGTSAVDSSPRVVALLPFPSDRFLVVIGANSDRVRSTVLGIEVFAAD